MMNYIEPRLSAIGRYIKGMGPGSPTFSRALKQPGLTPWDEGFPEEAGIQAAGPRAPEAREKVCVIGAGGMVGSGLMRALAGPGCGDIVGTVCHDAPYFGPMEGVRLERLDLRERSEVRRFFLANRPSRVFLAATAACGGEDAERLPATYLQEQLEMQSAVVHSAFEAGVERLLFVGSSRLYPRGAQGPLSEESMQAGPPEPCDEAFALARIAGLKMCQYYNRQYGTLFTGILPTVPYGPGDNFHPGTSRLIPSMIHRLHEARRSRLPGVTITGSCCARCDVLFVDDLARACMFIMDLPDETLRRELACGSRPCFVNAGGGRAVTFFELAGIAARVVGFDGRLVFDAPKADEAECRVLDASRLQGMGWRARVGLEQGIREAYEWYLGNAPRAFWY